LIDFPVTFKFDHIVEFRSVTSHRVFRIVLRLAVGRQGKTKPAHFDVILFTHELNLSVQRFHDARYFTASFPRLQYAIDVEVLVVGL